MKRKIELSPVTEALYADAEERANRSNLIFLAAMLVCELVCIALNDAGIFVVERAFMRASMLTGAAFSLVPLGIFLVHDCAMKRQPSVCRSAWFKIMIIWFVYLTVALFCVSLSGHAVPLLAVPPLIAAQYRARRWQYLRVIALTVVLVFLSIYGAYFFGTFDRDLHKGMATAAEAGFDTRVALATPQRLTELFTHHVMPRLLALTAVAVLANGVAHRNNSMLARQVELAEKVRREMEARNAMQSHVIDDLAALIESRDVSTGGHVKRTKRYVELIAREMLGRGLHPEELNEASVERIVRAAPLHDIGKIAISDRILQKPGRLTAEEFEEMKLHAAKGGTMVRNILGNLDDADFLKTASEIAEGHHERWDGRGYPHGLAGTDIPLPARIMAVADVFDALVSERCYKKPMSPEQAFQLIAEERGRQFDPEIADLMPALAPAFVEVMERLRDTA